jgi:hypothetical protein
MNPKEEDEGREKKAQSKSWYQLGNPKAER